MNSSVLDVITSITAEKVVVKLKVVLGHKVTLHKGSLRNSSLIESNATFAAVWYHLSGECPQVFRVC